MRAEALKGHLDGLLLAVLDAGPAHGYAVIEALRTGSGGTFDLPTGTVYPALHRLESLGLLRSSWSEGEGRRRRVYELTAAGRRALVEQRGSWRQFASAVSAVMGGGAMDRDYLTTLGLDPAALPVVAGYLHQLEAGLPLGRRARLRILAEVADGLASTIAAHAAAGSPAADAARDAIDEFGDPSELARLFAAEQAGVTAHRVGLGLLASGPLVGLTWVASYATANGRGPAEQIGLLLSEVAWYPLVLLVAVPAAVLAAAGAGPLARWIPVSPRVVTSAACVATAGCAVGDLMLLAASLRPGSPSETGLAFAAGLSVARLICLVAAGRRVVLLRGAVN